jgi:hypothetical protein
VVEAAAKVTRYTTIRQNYLSAGNVLYVTKASDAFKKWEGARTAAEKQRDHQHQILENASSTP